MPTRGKRNRSPPKAQTPPANKSPPRKRKGGKRGVPAEDKRGASETLRYSYVVRADVSSAFLRTLSASDKRLIGEEGHGAFSKLSQTALTRAYAAGYKALLEHWDAPPVQAAATGAAAAAPADDQPGSDESSVEHDTDAGSDGEAAAGEPAAAAPKPPLHSSFKDTQRRWVVNLLQRGSTQDEAPHAKGYKVEQNQVHLAKIRLMILAACPVMQDGVEIGRVPYRSLMHMLAVNRALHKADPTLAEREDSLDTLMEKCGITSLRTLWGQLLNLFPKLRRVKQRVRRLRSDRAKVMVRPALSCCHCDASMQCEPHMQCIQVCVLIAIYRPCALAHVMHRAGERAPDSW